jgi:glutathione synthase/RimK-type ligase-like ATP-grasp enzyme
LPVLQGLPDDMSGVVSLDEAGKLQVSLPGSALFRMHLPATEQARMPRLYIKADQAIRLPEDARGKPLINYVADPDRCSHSLLQILRIVDMLGSPCFNAPRAIARSGRHAVAKALAPIAGLHVPRTELIEAGSSAELVARIEAAGLRYPLLLRAPGMHMGATMAKVDAPDAVDAAVYDMPLQGRGIYVTEFVDYRDADGLYRKMRLAVVGKRVFMRHFAIASGWNVHIRDRIRMDDPEETRMLEGFPGSLAMDATALALQVADTLGLDYFGIDCCPRPDGRLLVFEANAAMDILAPEVSPTRQADWDRGIGTISQALQDLLRDPRQWRHGSRP